MLLAEIKLYLRVDDISEDEFIASLQIAAEEYLTNAGVVKDYTKELYKLAVKLLISNWYENRDIVTIGTVSTKLDYSLSHILIQLREWV